MAQIDTLCVFCGAAEGNDPIHRQAAERLGAVIGAAAVRLVFGGGHVGIMGILADAVLGAGGEAVGVIPRHLVKRELGHDRLTAMHVVDSMHARKQKMFDLSDGFAILPGGFGTLDEAFEIITWRQLGMHDKPIVLIDIGNYWRPFIHLVGAIVDAGFAHSDAAALFETVASPDDVLPTLRRMPSAGLSVDPSRF